MIKVSFIAVGLILLVLAAAIGISVRRFTQVATSADGVVSRLNESAWQFFTSSSGGLGVDCVAVEGGKIWLTGLIY